MSGKQISIIKNKKWEGEYIMSFLIGWGLKRAGDVFGVLPANLILLVSHHNCSEIISDKTLYVGNENKAQDGYALYNVLITYLSAPALGASFGSVRRRRIEKMRSIFFQRSKSSAVAGCAVCRLWRQSHNIIKSYAVVRKTPQLFGRILTTPRVGQFHYVGNNNHVVVTSL
jgi:hypothetical protein